MRRPNLLWSAALLLSGAALLSFLARTFIDYRFVYEEMNIAGGVLTKVTLLNLAFYAGWIWALVAASHQSRRAMFVLLAYNVLLLLFGIVTMTSLCPSPCRTAWPVGEIAIWSNVLVGAAAMVLALLSLLRRAGAAV